MQNKRVILFYEEKYERPVPSHYWEIIENANIDGLVQDCSNSIANALELLQSCSKPLI